MSKVAHSPPAAAGLDLKALVVELIADRDRTNERLAALEARMPPPRFEPKGWVTAKDAANITGFSLPTIYRFTRAGVIMSSKAHGLLRIDPATLPTARK